MNRSRKYQTYIDYGSGYERVYPVSIQPINILKEKDEYFVRYEMGELTFKNDLNDKVFNKIQALDFTDEIKIKIEGFGFTIEGYFGKNDIKVNNNKKDKYFKITPAIVDHYRPFLEGIETPVNVATDDIAKTTIYADVQSATIKTISDWQKSSTESLYGYKNLKLSEYEDAGGIDVFFNLDDSPNTTILTTPPFDAKDKNGLNIGDRISILEEEKYELSKLEVWQGRPYSKFGFFFNDNDYIDFYITTELTKEETFLYNIPATDVGDQQYPDGEGWEQTTETPIFVRGGGSGGGYGYLYRRKPFNGAYSSDWNKSEKFPNDGTGGGTSFDWEVVQRTSIEYPSSINLTSIQTTMALKDLMSYVYRNISDSLSLKNVYSTFLFNDGEGDLPFMDGRNGSNYVTWESNILNNLKAFHTYDIRTDIDESSQNTEDSELNITFQQIIDELKKYWPIYYFIDDEYNLWIEHVKYFDLIKSVEDISSKQELDQTDIYEFDKSVLFDKKVVNQINSSYRDFTNNEITFAQAVSNNRNKDSRLDETTEIFTTDLRYCLENPNDLENGLVLIIDDNSGNVFNKVAPITGENQVNGVLAVSNLLNDYWRYEGVWKNGQINGVDVNFENAYRSKLGEEINIRGLFNSLFYKTTIGIGLVESGSLDFDAQATKLKLRYRYSSNEIGDQDQYLVYAEDGIYNFENEEI